MTVSDRLLVVVESPLRGHVPAWVPLAAAPWVERFNRWRNRRYALACMRDALARGEAPYASHVLFDQRGLLDDAAPEQRAAGINAGLAWGRAARVRAVYCDRGLTDGMYMGILATPPGQVVQYRWLYERRDPDVVARVQAAQAKLRARHTVGANRGQ